MLGVSLILTEYHPIPDKVEGIDKYNFAHMYLYYKYITGHVEDLVKYMQTYNYLHTFGFFTARFTVEDSLVISKKFSITRNASKGFIDVETMLAFCDVSCFFNSEKHYLIYNNNGEKDFLFSIYGIMYLLDELQKFKNLHKEESNEY